MTRTQRTKDNNFKSLIRTLIHTINLLESMKIDNGDSVVLAKQNLHRTQALYALWLAKIAPSPDALKAAYAAIDQTFPCLQSMTKI